MLINILLAALPPTRFFAIKRFFLRLLGVGVGDGTRVCGRVKFYGAGRVSIGVLCWIGVGTTFHTAVGGDVSIGDRCDVAPDVAFVCGSHVIGDSLRRAGEGIAHSISVGSGTWIGVRTTLMGGVEVGESCVIGANSLLLKNCYRKSSLIFGAPARVARSLD